MIKSGLIPTTRAVVDVNRVCNVKCRMCYYAYDDSNWSKPIEKIKKELDAARERGNTSVDFTGGEPTIYPRMNEVVKYSESIGLHTCIITNGLVLDKIKELTEAGCREWLVSVHGFEEQHNEILQLKRAWENVNKAIKYLNQEGCILRVNCTLTRYNAKDLPKLAQYFIDFARPRIVNFINFNPHYNWGNHEQPEVYQSLNDVQVKVSDVAPYLKEALDILNSHNMWTNVRYFPLCLLRDYESHICNNPQVMFDPYEWDYGISPKTEESYLAYGQSLQERIGSKEDACGECGMLNVCGGIHKNYAKIHGFSELRPYAEQSDYPYYFKKDIEADIIIPAYEPNQNLQEYLPEIIRNTVPPYNIIQPTRRQSAARNRNYGLERSKSPYIIMCDDDLGPLPPAWNRKLINILKENRDIVAVSARLMNQDGTLGRNSANNYDVSKPIVEVEMIPTACCAFRKTDVRFDERYIRAGWEDSDFFMQLREKCGGKIVIANEVRVVHLNEEKNSGGTENEHNRKLFFRKWSKHIQEDQASAGAGIDVGSLNKEIEKCLEDKDFDGAMALIASATEAGITNAGLFNSMGYVCWETGQKEKALDCFSQSMNLEPDDRDNLSNFMDASYELGEFNLLEEHLRVMTDANPKSCEYLYLLSECLFRQDKFAEAEQRLSVLISADQDYPEALELRDRVRERLNGNGVSVTMQSITGNASSAQPTGQIDISMFNNAKHITRRGCIDVGHPCNIDCVFCYHRFEDRRSRKFMPKQEIMRRLKRDREEYNITVTDFTGGEPTIHPDIVEIVDYAASINNPICIITHGQWHDLNKIDAIIDAGLHEFLISIHGVQSDHDEVTNQGAFEKVMKGIEHLEKRGGCWRVNCVAHSKNMENLGDFARMISGLSYPPDNANFIVFSPLAGWLEKGDIDFQPRHSDLAPFLREAIETFSENSIWTNVRYYPMCMLPGLEKHITCFPQICYDPFGWDYRSYANADARTIMNVYELGKKSKLYCETASHIFHNTWSVIQSQRCYRKSSQCMRCSLRMVCDGVACQYRDRFGSGELKERPGELIMDPIYFRRHTPMAVGE